MGFRGGGVKLTPPPSVSWFSSTPAGIGLNFEISNANLYTRLFLLFKMSNCQNTARLSILVCSVPF